MVTKERFIRDLQKQTYSGNRGPKFEILDRGNKLIVYRISPKFDRNPFRKQIKTVFYSKSGEIIDSRGRAAKAKPGTVKASERFMVVTPEGKRLTASDKNKAKALAKRFNGAVIDRRSSSESIDRTLRRFRSQKVKEARALAKATAVATSRNAQILNNKLNVIYNTSGPNSMAFRKLLREMNKQGLQPSLINIEKATGVLTKAEISNRLRLAKLKPDAFTAKSLQGPRVPNFKIESKPIIIGPGVIPPTRKTPIKKVGKVDIGVKPSKSTVTQKLDKMGFRVPGDVVGAVRDSFRDWQALAGTAATSAIVAIILKKILQKIGQRGVLSAVPALATAVAGRDFINTYYELSGRYSPAYAATRTILTLGIAYGAAAGATSFKLKANTKSMRNFVNGILRRTKLGKDILKAINGKKIDAYFFDSKGIVHVKPKARTFKYTVKDKTFERLFKTSPTKTHRFALTDAAGRRRYVDSKTFKKWRKALGKRTLEQGLKENVQIAKKAATTRKALENIRLQKERTLLRKQQAIISKGRLPKAVRVAGTSKGFAFRDLKTNKIRYFKSRKQWLRAVKQQLKAIKAGKIKEPKPSPTGKFIIGGETITIKKASPSKLAKANKQKIWRIPRILKIIEGKPIYKYEKVDYRTFKQWAKAIRRLNKRKWPKGTLQDWNKMLDRSEKLANLNAQLLGTRTKTARKLSNRWAKAMQRNFKQREKMINKALESPGKLKLILQKPKQVTKVKAELKTKLKVKQVQVSKSKVKTKSIVAVRFKQPAKVRAIAKQRARAKTLTQAKTGLALSSKVVQAVKPRILLAPITKTKTIAISKVIARTNQLLRQKRIPIVVTLPKLIKVIPKAFKRIKRKPTKSQQEKIKEFLKKKPRVYRPSLAAILFNITGYAPPKTITGLEIRPILIKRSIPKKRKN